MTQEVWSCMARQVQLAIEAGSDEEKIQQMLEDKTIYLEIDGADRFLFSDNSILIIKDGECTVVAPPDDCNCWSTKKTAVVVFAGLSVVAALGWMFSRR